jgi:hypothetical protein
MLSAIIKHKIVIGQGCVVSEPVRLFRGKFDRDFSVRNWLQIAKELTMTEKKPSVESTMKNIRRKSKKKYTAEEKSESYSKVFGGRRRQTDSPSPFRWVTCSIIPWNLKIQGDRVVTFLTV